MENQIIEYIGKGLPFRQLALDYEAEVKSGLVRLMDLVESIAVQSCLTEYVQISNDEGIKWTWESFHSRRISPLYYVSLSPPVTEFCYGSTEAFIQIVLNEVWIELEKMGLTKN